MSTTLAGQAVSGSSFPSAVPAHQLTLRLRLFAALMRRMPTDIRRVDMLWHAFYHRLGGGKYTENQELDRRWPAGLQPGIRGTLHKQLMFLDLQDWSDRRSYFSGRFYQQDISRLLLNTLRPGDQFLDIGANIGMTTLVAASRIGSRGRALAFEPNPVAYSRLTRHIEANGLTNFEAVPAALSNCEGTAKLFLTGSHTGLSSLAPREEDNSQFLEIRTCRGDDFVDRMDASIPTLIKIDVEGYEVQAFEGMPRILEFPDILIVAEVSVEMLRRAGQSREILHARMQQLGFQAYSVELVTKRWNKQLELRHLNRVPELAKYDAVFIRPGTEFDRRIRPFLVDDTRPEGREPATSGTP